MSEPGLDQGYDHAAAAETFVARARSRFSADIEELYVFGSTASGEAEGLSSDVDLLIVLRDAADRAAVSDGLHEIAYDVMLEHGPVVELHLLTESEFTESRDRGNPFLERVLDQGHSYA